MRDRGRSDVFYVWATFLAVAALIGGMMVLPAWQERGARAWRETTCTLEARHTVSSRHKSGTSNHLEVDYSWRSRGASYHGRDVTLASRNASGRVPVAFLAVGETFPCWYDPAQPQRAVIARGEGYHGGWLLLVFGGALLAIFGALLPDDGGEWAALASKLGRGLVAAELAVLALAGPAAGATTGQILFAAAAALAAAMWMIVGVTRWRAGRRG